MNKKLSVTCLLVSLVILASAQIKWPSVTPVTKPWTRWWWMGSAVNPKDLSANMEKYKEAGLGGVEITPIYGVKGYEDQFVDYLSPQWMKLFTWTLNEAKRLNIQVDIATGTGWPFGGGPLIGDADASKDFSYKTWSLKEGEKLAEPVIFIQEPFVRAVSGRVDIEQLKDPVYTNKNLQALALDQVKFRKRMPLQVLMAYSDKNEMFDITSKVDTAGTLQWQAPAGNWTLYAIFMGWHGKMVERAAPGGEGNAIDHFSLPALKKYLGRFDKAFAGNDYSYLRGFFNDSYEVDDARGQSNWTPGFLDQFKMRRGYDLKQYLPSLLKKSTAEMDPRILHDYRQTIGDLLLENFTHPWHDWAKAKGKIVRNQSHGSPANILDLYAAIDIPETEGKDLLRYKFATSTANVTGKPLASAEAATWLHDHFKSSLSDIKAIVDNYFLGGVNHIVYHGTAYSPVNDPWPGWLFYAAVHFQPTNPEWRDFGTLNNYVTRCQSFLQSGTPNNDVLLYFPYHDKISEPGRDLLIHFDGMNGFENSPLKASAEFMMNNGFTFDLISDKQLEKVTFANNKLHSGRSDYQVLLLPDIKYIPLKTLIQILDLAGRGAIILVYKNWPLGPPGKITKEDQQSFDLVKSATLFFKDQGDGTQKTSILKGAIIIGNDMEQLLKAAKVRQEKMYSQGISFLRRKYAQGEYYFISNRNQEPFHAWINVNTKAAGAALYDPMFARAGIAKTRRLQDGTLEIYLQLQPGETRIIQTAAQKMTGNAFPCYEPAGEAIPVSGEWNVQFVTGGPTLPSAIHSTQLSSWTDLPDTSASRFSGTAKYTIHFLRPPASAPAYLLSLGKVSRSAEVRLNGKKIATLIGPAYEAEIPSNLFLNDNLLEVFVTNGMANRIIDLEKRGVVWKKFYNTNFPANAAENRGPDGQFTAIRWHPELSGLTGPVTLTPLSLQK